MITAHLHGEQFCEGEGLAGRGEAPVLALCRALVNAGVDPDEPMDVYRGTTVALHIRSIGVAARLRIRGDRVGFQWTGSGPPAPPSEFDGGERLEAALEG
jgi:hypothetical protein